VTGSIAESLSLLGLVVGFPLLLLGLMIGLEKLESWGLREPAHEGQQPQLDKVEAAVQSVEHMMAAAASQEAERAAARSNGRAQHPVRLND
jgi:hypothetical protein